MWRSEIKKILFSLDSTYTGFLVTDFSLPPVDIPLRQEPVYSDEQFQADLKKSAKRLDKMKKKALAEHRQGKTRKFP